MSELYPSHYANGKKIRTCLLTNECYFRGVLILYYLNTRRNIHFTSSILMSVTSTGDPSEIDSRTKGFGYSCRAGYSDIIYSYSLTSLTSYSVTESRFNATWSKVYIFRLEQFERIAVLDGDILVLKNMDELMDVPISDHGLAACHACVCNPRRLSYYPSTWYSPLVLVKRVPDACAYTYQSYPASVKEGMLLSFPHGLSELNGGLQIFKPCRAKFERIYGVLNTSTPSDFLFANQTLLSKTFHGE